MSKVMAVLQARFSSTRLPGKVLRPILGEPMLWRQIERIQKARSLDSLLLATSADTSDDKLADAMKSYGVAVFRGNLNNVLDRFYQAVKSSKTIPEHVVRLTGDCPLVDPELIDEIVHHHVSSGADYTSNSVQPTYPDGLDVEVMTFSALEEAHREANLPSHFEHVTPYLHQNPAKFKIVHHRRSGDDLSSLRWTVDEPADFEIVSKIYESLYPQNPTFTTKDILTFLSQNEALLKLNADFERNEGLMKSYREDLLHKGKQS
jgi:spore coat polysaccharide biosynthesis protein SpsF